MHIYDLQDKTSEMGLLPIVKANPFSTELHGVLRATRRQGALRLGWTTDRPKIMAMQHKDVHRRRRKSSQ